MHLRSFLAVFAACGLTLPVQAQLAVPGTQVSWKRIVIDKTFRSEGVGVADVNKDGKKDIITGDVWYEAPDWKMHVLSKERKFDIKGWDPIRYSESFAVFPDDFNGDGWVDVIVIPFPGKECYWYENPGKKGGSWKQHFLTNSACNETPIYVDLFGKGKKYLVMGWQPPGKTNEGEMCYFVPGKDPTKPWDRISISGPSIPKKLEQPGTQRFSHGLGHGDVNGDGRIDVIVPQGWWEQPATRSPPLEGGAGRVTPWTFHQAKLGPAAADMYAYDVDGDGKNDVISSSAHLYGFWWHQQKSPTEFLQREFFPLPTAQAKEPEGLFNKEESVLFAVVGKLRQKDHLRAPWRANIALSRNARAYAEAAAAKADLIPPKDAKFDGKVLALAQTQTEVENLDTFVNNVLAAHKLGATDIVSAGLEVGVGFAKSKDGKGHFALLIGDSGKFSLPSQTHALHFIDINGDGLKDLVTGRRWWAHGPKGDAGPNDPAYIYWFEAKKNKDGSTDFTPRLVDDDSGIGTAFAVEDLDGDGIPDIIISNKRGVYAFLQVRGRRE